MHRRDFLRPQHAAEAVGQLLGAASELAPAPMAEAEIPDAAVIRLGWRAMATGWEIVLPVSSHQSPATGHRGPMPAGRDAFELLDRLEDQLTVYRDQSEVSRLNRSANARPVRAEAQLFGLLQLAQKVSAATDGAFDATIGTLIKAWGFFKGPKRVPSEAELAQARARAGWRHVTLDDTARSVKFAVPGLELNLGSIGKGYALDRLASRLARRWKIDVVLLHGGSSSVYAKGCPYNAGRGWAVDIRHPHRPETRIARVRLNDRALGTSAATFQYLEHEGRKLGHVLDARTGWPATGTASATALAPSAALADALSSAFFVGGVELARQYCRLDPTVGAVLLPEGAESPVLVGNVVAEALPA